ncbi:hypothetical protein DAPPUDRAFT_260034 [Daphnia pulex]|uniref:Uncharacterized protein n=1 Tax=Daphnia pulex TaxID=6669 RepID=E9HIC9_DAPPU|nr:hypothetical protein DAPPUDRAFT_260034 [Daphnia pulex]|eukprot:EFX68516.1 hypothetical protein DAPPUDRAFT_260034 [Daphnia pulex]
MGYGIVVGQQQHATTGTTERGAATGLGTTTGTTSAVWLRHSDIIDHGGTAASGLLSTEPIEDFEDLAGNLTSESLNSVDSQGYTLLEWATVFSTSDWPIDQFLMEKGAEIQTDERLFRRNVFFIALQYLPSSNKSRFLSFDGIDIHGVNQTGDTALHLTLYGEKWNVAEKILKEFPDYDVNTINSLGDTPLHSSSC